MDEFFAEMAEILEEDTVAGDAELNSFESWDSLAVLSVIAFADTRFGVSMSAQEVTAATTIEDLYQRITAKRAA